MKDIVKNLLECALNCNDSNIKENLEEEVRNLIDTLLHTYNAPSDWRNIKEKLQEEYSNDNDALEIIGY